jgi:hypothetical protein
MRQVFVVVARTPVAILITRGVVPIAPHAWQKHKGEIQNEDGLDHSLEG